ncbi:MAG: protein kinase [Gemmatimonadales bacterium]
MPARTCPTCETELPDDAAFCAQCGSATATQIFGEPSVELEPGRQSASYATEPERLQRILGPNFRLGRLIGRGGYAEVFAVQDLKLNRELAIKVLRPDLIVTPNLLARFRREALAVAALNHPHIVPVYDVGEAGGVCYLVMPLIQGESLKDAMSREGRIPVAEATRILLEAASALTASHEAGVVHRDIKPENIVLEGRDRRVRLMDFGIAKAMDGGDRDLTGTGVVVGTPQYMSPEQASGEATVDHRTDQYSLAVIGYQMLGGQVPFGGETARAVITKLLLESAPRLDRLAPGLPPSLVATLHRALEKDPARRFATTQDFAAALKGELAPTAGLPPAPRGPVVRRWAAGAAVLTTVVVAVAMAVRNNGSRQGELGPAPEASPAPPPPAVPPVTPAVVAPPPPPAARRDTGTALVIDPDPVLDTTRRAPPRDTVPAEPVAPPPDCEALYGRQEWVSALGRCAIESDSGSARASRRMASLIRDGRAPALGPGETLKYLEAAGRAGDALALFELGERYSTGNGAALDPTLATNRYLGAANAGFARAFPIVAQRLDQGLGVVRDRAAALDWFVKAAGSGDVQSQVLLGRRYADGDGVDRDYARARSWLDRAAQAGSPEAQYQLALLYFNGRGVDRSDETGMEWLRRAAAAGHQQALRELERRR